MYASIICVLLACKKWKRQAATNCWVNRRQPLFPDKEAKLRRSRGVWHVLAIVALTSRVPPTYCRSKSKKAACGASKRGILRRSPLTSKQKAIVANFECRGNCYKPVTNMGELCYDWGILGGLQPKSKPRRNWTARCWGRKTIIPFAGIETFNKNRLRNGHS